MTPRISSSLFPIVLAIAACSPMRAVSAQQPIDQARVREVVSWLAHDDRRGRESGSVELEQAADWIQAQFEQAGLRPGGVAGWFHEFQLPGVRLDSKRVQLTLSAPPAKEGAPARRVVLTADEDVRLWLPGERLSGEEPCTLVHVGNPVADRLMRARSARRPIVLVVPEEHDYWRKAAGEHVRTGRRRGTSRPVFLVREAALQAAEQAGQVEEWLATWEVEAGMPADVPLRNVVGLLPAAEGSPHADEYVVVSAHYDHIGTGVAKNGDAIYNGADDDASGTTAVVVLAEALAAGGGLARNVLFVCFAAEEMGLLGSKAFCERPPVPLDAVVVDINIEMIGRPEPGNEGKAWITGAGYSDFADVVAPALRSAGVEVVPFRMADQLFGSSDNASFWRRGVVAHSISAGSLHRDYHQPSDQVDKLDLAHMTRIVRGLDAVVRAFAARSERPAWSAVGEAFLERVRKGRR